MENFDEVSDLENFFQQSETFKNNKPFKFAFAEEIFKRDFYERLFETFPEYDKNDKKWERFVNKNHIEINKIISEIKNTINIFCFEKNKLIIRMKIKDKKSLKNNKYKLKCIFV